MNVRLFPDQVERLKKSVNGAEVIRIAFDRYKRGDFGRIVVRKAKKGKERSNVPHLQSYPVRKRLPVTDALLREILRRHWETPDTARRAKIAAEIARLDAEIDELMKAYTGVPYITEKGTEE